MSRIQNPFPTRIRPTSPRFAMGGMSLFLGLLIGLAWVTNQKRVQVAQAGVMLPNADAVRQIENLQATVASLRRRLSAAEKATAQKSSASSQVQTQLISNRIGAGLTQMSGPGISVTLKDTSKKGNEFEAPIEAGIIHDGDILRVVSLLWNSGAEAIAVNDQRVVTNTAFRCVGPVVHVNFVPVAPPIVIRAIGDPESLYAAVSKAGNVIDELKITDPEMVSFAKETSMNIPAFNGRLDRRFGTVPGEKKSP